MSNLIIFAKRELEIAGLVNPDSDYGGHLGEAVLKMVEQFSGEGHSRMSANLTISIFEKVACYEPLTGFAGLG
jgi:hypothetical protein